MSASPFVGIRVTPSMKTHLRRLAEREQISESALVKQVLQVLLRTAALDEGARVEELEKRSRDSRLSIRLDLEDQAMLAGRASERCMRPATYVSVLLRSHLRGVTPIPKDELLALKGSIAELRAIGNNLNQMAKALHQGSAIAPRGEHLAAMLNVAERLLDHVKALLIANEKSWGHGSGKSST